MSETNLTLWRRHCHTNPDDTKQVTQRGGYTAINPQSQAEAATAEFGPYGHGWGLSNLKYSVKTLGEGDRMQHVAFLEASFFYFWRGERVEFPIAADMTYRPGDDAFKKLRTQCQSKALSLLGFNADIFAGDWEIEGYQELMRSRFGDQQKRLEMGQQAIAKANAKQLDAIAAKVDREDGDGTLDAQVAEHLRARIAERREQIGGPPTAEELIANGELEPAEVGELFDKKPKSEGVGV